MRRIKKAVVFAAIFLLAGTLLQSSRVSAGVNDFTIPSFTADYYLDRNSSLTSTLKIREEIVAQFPNFDQNHGVLRAIPESYQGHTVSLSIESVAGSSGTIPYTTYSDSGNTVLKIGDANKFVHGLQTYIITYSMRNVINFQADGDEFYWDVNGDQWPQHFGTVTARIHIPNEVAATLQDQKRCFTGIFGATGENCLITNVPDARETMVAVTADNLQPYETLTFVLGFEKGTFVLGPEIAAERRGEFIRLVLITLGITVLPLLTLIFMLRRWQKYGKDPKGRGVIVPEYVPPKGFNALSSSVILEESLPAKAVTALIIELAVKRYLNIYETEVKGFLKTNRQYELELIRDPQDLSEEQKKILQAFFNSNINVGARVNVADLKNKLHKELKAAETQVSEELYKKGYFRSNPQKTRGHYLTVGLVLLIIGFAIVWLGIGVPIILSAAIILLFSGKMPARSPSGVGIRDYLYGLRDYMNLAEKDRINYLQSPKGAEKILRAGIDPKNPKSKVKLFEDLLPYAMLFGIEKEWAKQFKDIYTEPPDWYRGNWATFNAVYLASSIGNLSAASTTAFTAPSSSGSSGFGSGGFSGGGGGGGGGGGW